jgi:hypothetical protein
MNRREEVRIIPLAAPVTIGAGGRSLESYRARPIALVGPRVQPIVMNGRS